MFTHAESTLHRYSAPRREASRARGEISSSPSHAKAVAWSRQRSVARSWRVDQGRRGCTPSVLASRSRRPPFSSHAGRQDPSIHPPTAEQIDHQAAWYVPPLSPMSLHASVIAIHLGFVFFSPWPLWVVMVVP
jgi:hypothetical protein